MIVGLLSPILGFVLQIANEDKVVLGDVIALGQDAENVILDGAQIANAVLRVHGPLLTSGDVGGMRKETHCQ